MNKIALLIIVIGVVGVLFTAKGYFSSESIDGARTFVDKQIDKLVIDSTMAAKITILPSKSNEIEIEWKGMLSNLQANRDVVTFQEDGSRLSVKIGSKQKFRFPFFFHNGLFNSFHVDVLVPEKQYESITVNNTVGKIHISSVNVDVLKTKADVAGVTLEYVQADEIFAESSVGSIKLEQFTGRLYARSDVGSIDIVTDEITNDMELVSNVGSIELHVPTIQPNVSFVGNSDVGSVRIFGEKGSYVKNGADYIVSMKTDVGSIAVNLLR